MSYRRKNMDNSRMLSENNLNKSSINSPLMNMEKQLKNISINDVNVLKFKKEKEKFGFKKNKNISTENILNTTNHILSLKYESKLHKKLKSKNKLHFCHTAAFSIKGNNSIALKSLNKNDLRKKNYVLKENLKFLINEIKKYKSNENNDQDNAIKKYEDKIQYYVEIIKKYKKDILLLKQKYNIVVKENKKLRRNIQLQKSYSYKLNHLKGVNTSTKNALNNSTNNNSFFSSNLKKENLSIKKYMTSNRNSLKAKIASKTTRINNNKKYGLNIINNINSNKYLYIPDRNSRQYSNENILVFNYNDNKKSGFKKNSKIMKKKNTNIIFKNNYSFNRLKENNSSNNIDDNYYSSILLTGIGDNKINNSNINPTFNSNRISINSFKNTSIELNKTLNISPNNRKKVF